MRNKEDVRLVDEDQVRVYLSILDIHKGRGLMGHKNPIQMDSQTLRELANVIVRPLSVIFDGSWCLEQVHKCCRKEDDTGNYRLTSVPGEVIKQLILQTISRYIKDKRFIRRS